MHCIAITFFFFLNLCCNIFPYHKIFLCNKRVKAYSTWGEKKQLETICINSEKQRSISSKISNSHTPALLLSQETLGIWVMITCAGRARKRSDWSLVFVIGDRDSGRGVGWSHINSGPLSLSCWGLLPGLGPFLRLIFFISFPNLFAFPF